MCGLLEAGPNANWHPRAGQAPVPEVSGYQSPTLLRAAGPTVSPCHSSRRLAPQPRPLEPRPAKELVINQALQGRPRLLASDMCGQPLLAQPPPSSPHQVAACRLGWGKASLLEVASSASGVRVLERDSQTVLLSQFSHLRAGHGPGWDVKMA